MNLQISLEELRKQSIFIATPMYGGQCFGSYTKSLLDLSKTCQQYGINAQFSFIFNESLITRARNYMVDEFMRSGFDKLMFIDSDIDFNPIDVLTLASLDKPIIGGPYPKKCIAWETIYDAVRFGLVPNDQRERLADYAGDFVFNTAPGTTEIRLDTPAEVLEIGTGFMMVKREVFTKFSEAYPQYWYNPDHNRSAAFNGDTKIFQYFQAEIVPTQGRENHERYLSEDYWFCQKARDIGESVWVCPWMNLKHHGTHIYGGSIPAMANVVAHRIQRNEPVPTMVNVDATNKRPADTKATHAPTTVKEFKSGWSRSQRDAFLKQTSQRLGVDTESLQAAFSAGLGGGSIALSDNITTVLESLATRLV